MDLYPDYAIRNQFNGSHKSIVILDFDQNEIGRTTLSSGLNTNAKNYITNIIMENYQQVIIGDINADEVVNVQDIILMMNMILNENPEDSADLNGDNNIDILDVVLLVNIILQ